MYEINNCWDKLKTCVVGDTYNPDFFDWVKNPAIRDKLQCMVDDTKNFCNRLATHLESHDVEVLRPDIPKTVPINQYGLFPRPPVTPRDYLNVIDNRLFYRDTNWITYYNNIKDPRWNYYATVDDFLLNAPSSHVEELYEKFNLNQQIAFFKESNLFFQTIADVDKSVTRSELGDGGMSFHLGDTILLGKWHKSLYEVYKQQFPNKQILELNSEGHIDGWISVITEGLIVAGADCDYDFKTHLPDWEIVYVDNRVANTEYQQFKTDYKNWGGYSAYWYMTGIENDPVAKDFIDQKFKHWTGNYIESFFDINMLTIDSKNVCMSTANDNIIKVLDKYGINAHVFDVPNMRFWDGGIHCMTADLNRVK